MRTDLALLLGIAIPLGLTAAVVRFAWPTSRGIIASRIALVALTPLVLLSMYLVFEYRSWRWSIFPYGSIAPHAIAGALFLAGLVVIIARATAPTSAKIVVGAIVAAAWAMLWFTTALFTACLMGDCL
jgi:hypothetical protein